MMHIKVLVVGDEQEAGKLRFEITSMDDIFFHYFCNIDEQTFNQKIAMEQEVNIEYYAFYRVMSKMLD